MFVMMKKITRVSQKFQVIIFDFLFHEFDLSKNSDFLSCNFDFLSHYFELQLFIFIMTNFYLFFLWLKWASIRSRHPSSALDFLLLNFWVCLLFEVEQVVYCDLIISSLNKTTVGAGNQVDESSETKQSWSVKLKQWTERD